jgi:hypothetical protein
MSKTDDCGPAFAVRMGCDTNGMSLRDWFSGMALQGYLAGRNKTSVIERTDYTTL